MKIIEKEYFNYIKSDVYINYARNKKLFEGKSAEVFREDVLKRVKLEYMGVIDNTGCYIEYSRCGRGFIRESRRFETLIVPNGILAGITKVYTELGTNTEPIISADDNVKESLKKIDLQEKLEEILSTQSTQGRCLLRAEIIDKEPQITVYEVNQYFKLGRDYVIFTPKEDNIIAFEVHKKDRTEYLMAKEVAGQLKQIDYLEQLEEYGAIKEGLGYILKHKGYQVAEVRNIFNRSDYTEDLIKVNRELVIGETLTSQAFDKVANPLLQIPDGSVEYDEDGNLTVKLQDRVIIVEENDKEVKQVQMATKTAEWDIHRKNLIEQVYQQTGGNEQVFGLNKNGNSASGEAKKRDLERIISTVVSKRDKALVGLEKVMKWLYYKLTGTEAEIILTGKDILNLGFGEKVDIVTKGLQAGVISLDTAVKFLNITNKTFENELAEIKKENIKPLIDNLTTLNNLTTDNRINDYVSKMTEELIKELEI